MEEEKARMRSCREQEQRVEGFGAITYSVWQLEGV